MKSLSKWNEEEQGFDVSSHS